MSVPFPIYVEVVPEGISLDNVLPGNLLYTFQELTEDTQKESPVTFIVESAADADRYGAAMLLANAGARISVVDDGGEKIDPMDILREMPLSESARKQMEETGLLPLTSLVLQQKDGAEDPWFF